MKKNQFMAVRVVSPSATLKSIDVGDTRIIKNKAIKENVVRSTASRLAKYGYTFNVCICTEGVSVTRVK